MSSGTFKTAKIATLDIECESEIGFPEPTLADGEGQRNHNQTISISWHIPFGIGPWDAKPANVTLS